MLWSALMTVEIGAVGRQGALLLDGERADPVLKYGANESS